MSNRLVHLLLLSAGLCTTGVVIVLSSSGVATPAQVTVHVAAPTATVARTQNIVLLPTIVVHPDPLVPTLGTITVHASSGPAAIDKANVSASDYDVVSHTAVSSLVSLPGSSFDMPYYSFGKSVRRVNKE